MKYMTVEERELYKKVADRYKLKNYSVPFSLSCQVPHPEIEEQKKNKMRKKKRSSKK